MTFFYSYRGNHSDSRVSSASFLEFYHRVGPLFGGIKDLACPEAAAFVARTAEIGFDTTHAARLFRTERGTFLSTLWLLDRQRGTSDPVTTWHDLFPTGDFFHPGVQAERELWTRFDKASLCEKFTVLPGLSLIYLRYRREGGTHGTTMLDFVRHGLLTTLKEGNRYWELVENYDSVGVLRSPGRLNPNDLPPFLSFPVGVPRPLVIHVDSAPAGLGGLAYFLLAGAALALCQDVVCTQCAEKLLGLYRSGASLPPIQVSIDRGKETYHVWDGYHRTAAVTALGADYILGKVVYNYSMAGPRLPRERIRTIDHEEHLRVIATRNGDGPPSLTGPD